MFSPNRRTYDVQSLTFSASHMYISPSFFFEILILSFAQTVEVFGYQSNNNKSRSRHLVFDRLSVRMKKAACRRRSTTCTSSIDEDIITQNV